MRHTLVLGLAFLAACNPEAADDNRVQLRWENNQEFHVAAEYRRTSMKTETVATALDPNMAAPDLGADWSEEVVWTYQVVETGLVPPADDQLYEYALGADGEVASLSVVRAYVDPSLNSQGELLEAEPVIYMVFREDRDRLAAIISFTTDDGVRVEKAWSTTDLGRSYSKLSQSMLTAAPTYLAPFTARFETDSKILENGSLLETEADGEGRVHTYYNDELGGGLVVSTYEIGQPWPSYTESDNLRATLLSADDVDARRLPLYPDPPENYDYKRALSARVDLDKALSISADDIEAGTWTGVVPDGYRPWAGSWWRLSDAALVFGYDSRDTLSDKMQDPVRPLKLDMDRLQSELRELDKGSDDYKTKVEEYQAKNKELVETLVKFYDQVLQELNGGYMTIADGKLSHEGHGEAGEDAVLNLFTVDFEYEIDELSPFDKYALQMYSQGQKSPNPFYASAWEILNQWNPGGGSWWGHCNGWSAAAILTNEPREDITTDLAGNTVTWTTADQKGLLTEAHYSTYSSFYGSRYNDENDDISDLSPKHFHQIIEFYHRELQVPFVFDTTAGDAVWNYPAWKSEVRFSETTPEGALGAINVNTASFERLQDINGIGEALASDIIKYREAEGPFQTVDELTSVSGIGETSLDGMRAQITVSPVQRTFDVVADVTFTTDGVGETHVDYDINDPKGFVNTYRYTLTTDEEGNVLDGQWRDDKEHPDFAWVPYSNPMAAANGGSENPYIVYRDIVDHIVDLRRD